MFNSFLGSPAIVRALMESKKAELMASPLQRRLLKKFGFLIIRALGWPISVNSRLQARILCRFLAGQKGKMLDAGGSYGAFSFHFARLGWNVRVVDFDQDTLRVGRAIKEHLGVNTISFHYGNLMQTDFKDGEFDAILLCHVLEHIKEDVMTLRELHRVLRPGGILAIVLPYSQEDIEYDRPKYFININEERAKAIGAYTDEGHWREGYSFERLQSLLKRTGFTVEDRARIAYSTLLPNSTYAFPITFLLSRFPLQIKNQLRCIAVKARRES